MIKRYKEVANSYHISALKKDLDEVFYELTEVYNPLLLDKSLKIKSDLENNLKQIYEIDNSNIFLRFDHTHIMLEGEPYLWRNIPIKNVGPVFRKGFSSGYRWNEFYQYDVDYPYEEYKYLPIIKFYNYLKRKNIKFTLQINDLQVLKNSLKQPFNEDNISKKIPLDFDFRSYANLVKEKHPLGLNCEVKPTLVRGWNYYQDLVFEFDIYIEELQKTISVAGGGVYLNLAFNKAYIGMGIGMDRLLKIDKSIVKKEKIILIYNKSKLFPKQLVEEIEKKKLLYIIKNQKNSFITDYKKITHSINQTTFEIGPIVILNENQIKNNTYKYKVDKGKPLNLDELLKQIVNELY